MTLSREPITLKPEEAAELLGISARTLQDWTADGFVPSIKRGAIRLYSVDALRQWAVEESGREESRGKAKVGNGVGLPAGWGRTVGRGGQRPPTSIRKDRARGQTDAG